MQGGPGPTGLKGNRGDSGPAVRTVFTPDLHLLNHIMPCLNLCLTPCLAQKGLRGLPGPPGLKGKLGKTVCLEYCRL